MIKDKQGKGKKNMRAFESYLVAGTSLALEVAWRIIKKKLKERNKSNR